MKKSQKDIQAIKEVQRATEKAMEAVIAYIRDSENPTSEEAHGIIDKVLAQYDCESPEGHIVAGGLQSAEPHEIGTGALEKGKPIVIDIYPRSKTTGFYADMSRTVCIGTPSPELQKMYDTVLSAQELTISMLKPRVACNNIQKTVEQFFIDAGYETSGTGKEFTYAEGFVHSIGHGVGREIHEKPFFGGSSTDILQEGDAVTIEPGLYYKDIGGVRIEDLLLITNSGSRNLTQFSKAVSI